MYLNALSNKSFERTARQLASHQSCVVSFRQSLAGGQPLNSSVGRLMAALPIFSSEVQA
jgi:hypothetical protein